MAADVSCPASMNVFTSSRSCRTADGPHASAAYAPTMRSRMSRRRAPSAGSPPAPACLRASHRAVMTVQMYLGRGGTEQGERRVSAQQWQSVRAAAAT